jgi:hypothetical protein
MGRFGTINGLASHAWVSLVVYGSALHDPLANLDRAEPDQI